VFALNVRCSHRKPADAASAFKTCCIFDNTAAFAATGDALTTRRLVQAG
jgi:hypothetical protein